MNIEKFEKILRWKYDNGKRDFVGNLSGNKYHISNITGRTKGYTLFVNGVARRINARFIQVAWEIWDIESEVAGVEE